jgi:hypothetical protein
VPEKDDAVAQPAKAARTPSYRRSSDEEVVRAARRLVRGSKAVFTSQNEFRAAVTRYLRHEDPLAVIGGRRLRRLLVGVPGIRVAVRYTEREDGRALTVCPVCGSELRPIRNQTLGGEPVVLGQRCTRCDYWTHRARRVPTRYRISSARAPRSDSK